MRWRITRQDEQKAREKADGDEKKLAKIEEKFSSRIDAIVDFKSGKKAFYDEYVLQLALYKEMWNENFPDKTITRIFNVSPKDWTKTAKKAPSYNFEEQTDKPIIEQLPFLLELYKMRHTDEKKVVVMSGEIDLDKDLGTNVSVYSLSELVKENHSQEIADDGGDLFSDSK